MNKLIEYIKYMLLLLRKDLHLLGNVLIIAFLERQQYQLSLPEKCPNTEFFCSVFSRIWTDYRDYGPEKLCILEIFRAVSIFDNGGGGGIKYTENNLKFLKVTFCTGNLI